MNGEDRVLYEQLVYEREHRSGWFRTPPPAPAERSPETIELVKRVLTEREKGKGRYGSASVDSANERGYPANGK